MGARSSVRGYLQCREVWLIDPAGENTKVSSVLIGNRRGSNSDLTSEDHIRAELIVTTLYAGTDVKVSLEDVCGQERPEERWGTDLACRTCPAAHSRLERDPVANLVGFDVRSDAHDHS